MKNRHGDVYDFVQVDEDTYKITGDLKYWRFGGKEGQAKLDMSDLGMVDPAGGPFVEVGMQLFGREIVKISVSGDLDGTPNVYLEVE